MYQDEALRWLFDNLEGEIKYGGCAMFQFDTCNVCSRKLDELREVCKAYHCAYAYRWLIIKAKYGLSMTAGEVQIVGGMVTACDARRNER